jgi:hypothetical protein
MSSSSAIADSIVSLNNMTTQINRYFSLLIFIFGTIGNILNILVLLQKPLRSNPCAVFFFASSVTSLIALLGGLTPRVLSFWTNDLSDTIQWICKIRGFSVFTFRAAALWLIVLATVDRWLLSSVDAHRRHLSTVKNAQRGIITVIFLSIVIHSQILYCYESNLVNAPSKCFSNGMTCRLVNDMLFAIIAILIPLFLMTILGAMTISNVRHARNRIHSVHVSVVSQTMISTARQQRSNKTDQHLLIMLFVQVILLALFTIPVSIEKLYSTLTSNYDKSRFRLAIENFIYNFVLLLSYLAIGMPFYIYTLSGGSIFRKTFFNLIRLAGRRLIGR